MGRRGWAAGVGGPLAQVGRWPQFPIVKIQLTGLFFLGNASKTALDRERESRL